MRYEKCNYCGAEHPAEMMEYRNFGRIGEYVCTKCARGESDKIRNEHYRKARKIYAERNKR